MDRCRLHQPGGPRRKIRQVRIMHRIYRHAARVVVHLGEHTPGSGALFAELEKADEDLASISFYVSPNLNATIIEELEQLLQRPWFSRVWVTQEAASNEELKFMCGNSVVSRRALDGCFFGYSAYNKVLTKRALPITFRGPFQLRQSLETDAVSYLMSLLIQSRECVASDERDKVFALKSLVNMKHQGSLDRLIDYTKDAESLFQEIALLFLSRFDAAFLVCTRHPHQRDMPSWVPDWSQSLPLRSGWLLDQRCAVDGWSSDRMYRVVPNPKASIALCTYGAEYARITHFSEPFVFERIEDVELPIVALYHNSRPLCDMFHLDARESGAHHRFGWPIWDAMRNMCPATLHSLLSGSGTFYNATSNRDNARPDLYQRWAYFYLRLQGSCIALLDNGVLTVVPQAAQVGDVICLISGAPAPCLLRPLEEGYWKMASGDCPIPGLL
ncbi:hypothetical protein M011DRAFT_529884 [Sporormia fimetaria CBS 119925]|uniref:Heterokaryon incompatibility domain-containing protein n=1 Tax=Sporormia fimetaria CBS 119925 TaxID=1340428 RepID=A0A6A6UY74_9PLEO|nr:hypothetical protein M011DRAFT_529884 [Sporormia fimetaria CBS 119925]